MRLLTTLVVCLLAATCQAGPKRNRHYDQVDDLMSNDVFEDESDDRSGGSRALSRAINVNVNPKAPLLFRTNAKKKPKKKNLHTRRQAHQ